MHKNKNKWEVKDYLSLLFSFFITLKINCFLVGILNTLKWSQIDNNYFYNYIFC